MSKVPEKEFYRDVDRSRYHANWGCLIWFFVLGVLALVFVWWITKRSSWP